jgi:hypothetical protein
MVTDIKIRQDDIEESMAIKVKDTISIIIIPFRLESHGI